MQKFLYYPFLSAGGADGLSTLRNRKAKPLITTLMFCAVSATAAIAMDRGQFANVPLELREWFETRRSQEGIPCCSYADGHRTGYDMRQGQYWVPIGDHANARYWH